MLMTIQTVTSKLKPSIVNYCNEAGQETRIETCCTEHRAEMSTKSDDAGSSNLLNKVGKNRNWYQYMNILIHIKKLFVCL